jgi:homocysteine S-methyltransferase
MERGWLERLLEGDVVLIDGGTGSELRRRGVPMSPEAWSGLAGRDSHAVLRSIHEDFIRAGAEVITTNTFGTSRFVLQSAGLDEHFAAINRCAVNAAKAARAEAADEPVAIAGSISCFPPRFDRQAYPPSGIERDAYRELAALLADCGVDLIALEMMQDIEHGSLALSAALETGLPVWLGVSARQHGDRLVAYDYPERPLEPVLEELIALGPTVVNVMHTPVDAVGAATAAVRRYWRGPLGVYPELGDAGSRDALAHSPERFVGCALDWVGLGVRLLGGCCGSGPEHLAALAAARPQLLAARPPRA